MDAVGDQPVDRLAHPNVIQRHHGNAVQVARQRVEMVGQGDRIEYVGMVDFHFDLVRRQARAKLDRMLFDIVHEGVGALRQHEAQPNRLVARQPGGQPVGPVVEPR